MCLEKNNFFKLVKEMDVFSSTLLFITLSISLRLIHYTNPPPQHVHSHCYSFERGGTDYLVNSRALSSSMPFESASFPPPRSSMIKLDSSSSRLFLAAYSYLKSYYCWMVLVIIFYFSKRLRM